MEIIKKYAVYICIAVAVIILLAAFASYLITGENERIRLAQLSCVFAVAAIAISFLRFDKDD